MAPIKGKSKYKGKGSAPKKVASKRVNPAILSSSDEECEDDQRAILEQLLAFEQVHAGMGQYHNLACNPYRVVVKIKEIMLILTS